MNAEQMVDAMVEAVAEAVWKKLEARVDERIITADKIRDNMSALLDSMNLEEHIDLDRIADQVQERVKDDFDADSMVADEVSAFMRRADLTDYIDAVELGKQLDLPELVREEVRKLNFTVKVD